MIPTNYDNDDEEDDMTGFEVENDPSLTYAMQIGTIENDSSIFLGKADGEEANRQAILKILNTERYKNVIYSWDYGVELQDLRGKPLSYVMSEVPSRIMDAITVDDRFESCEDFEMEPVGKKALHVTFSVITAEGDKVSGLETEVEY